MHKLLVVASAAVLFLGMVPGASFASVSTSAKRPGCASFYQGNIFISVAGPGRSPTQVIGIDKAGTANKDRAILANYDPNAVNQRWEFRICILDGVYYKQLRNRKSGLCLDKSEDVPNGNGNKVYQYTCSDGGDNQLWQQLPKTGVTNGKWQLLVNRAGQGCVDIENEKLENGARLVQWACVPNSTDGTSPTQLWNVFL